MSAARAWADLSAAEIAALPADRAVVVLPVAAIEQHGPHLPLSVDADINRGILEAALDRLDPGLVVLTLPAQDIGLSDEHVDFAGTLSFPAETVIDLWTRIGLSVAAAGPRKLLIFNSHGGQSRIVDIVVQRLRQRAGLLAFGCSSYRLYDPTPHFPEAECVHGIHAGAVETSIMLHLHPDRVRDGQRAAFRPSTLDLAERFTEIGASGIGVGKIAGYGWQSQDLNASGAAGDATDADAARGRQLVEEAAARLAAILAEIDRMDPDAVLADADPAVKAK